MAAFETMAFLSALLTLSLAATVTLAAESTCENLVTCPCGSTGKYISICTGKGSEDTELCKKWSRCKSCQDGLNKCLQCEDGFKGPLCSTPKRQKLKSRQKRQYYVYGGFQQRPGIGQMNPNQQGYCRNLDSPKLGSIRCISNDQRRSCVGRCLPGYNFQDHESVSELALTCERGVWIPLNAFPPCISEGHCDLIVQGAGSYNCTTGMQGTRCDVNCDGRYIGRYYCYPGRSWDPPLPHCLRSKEAPENRQYCSCQYGASCDSSGNCVCPVGRTGTFCEIIVPDKSTCTDPGFVSNAFRRLPDGSESNAIRSFEEGESVVYGCRSDRLALQGSSLLTCKNDGTWSNPLPRCITPVASPNGRCSDPGQVINADRLNTDGSPSMGVQRYGIGQSVVYTCHPGFALQRRSLITCLASGSWSSRKPYCTALTSPDFLVITTTERPLAALRYCRDIGVDLNGSRQPRSPPNLRGFPQGSRVEYSCNPGYDLVGESYIFCLTSGRWSARRPTCEAQERKPGTSEPDYCRNPGPIANGEVLYYSSIDHRRRGEEESGNEDPEYPVGSRLQFLCNNGYRLEGTSLSVCESSGLWSTPPPTCKRGSVASSYCLNPGPISNGLVVHIPSSNSGTQRPREDVAGDMQKQYPKGSRLQYSCDNGYTLEGSDTLSCKNGGSWSANPPVCINVRSPIMFCDNPGTIFNGRFEVIPSALRPRSDQPPHTEVDYPEGTELEYTCDDGFILQGSYSMRCLPTSYWSSVPPTCVADCGRSFMETTRRILHGEKTVSGEWPWVVAISTEKNNVTRVICGGAVLNTRTVLTAAHCLTEATKFTLHFGKLYRRNRDDDSEVLYRRSTRLLLHPDFSNSTLDSDIGLITFQPKIRYTSRIQPICLPTRESTAKNLMTGNEGYVTGWGITEKRLQSDVLLLASLPVLTNEACMESYRNQNLILPITRNMFCAGFPNAQQSVCSGDSGSPLVFYDNLSKRYTVEGLVSFGAEGQCGLPGRYTIFTKVFRFLPWILRNL